MFQHFQSRLVSSNDLSTINASKLAKLIDEKGAKIAYDSLKKAYVNKDVGLGHAVTHIFGEVLYKKIGAKGLGVCDDAFAYACFHGLFIAAINQHGNQAAYQLNDYCQKNMPNNFECPHGLGHGLVEYNGHNQLKKSLVVCDNLPSNSSKFGCAMGVFMEYNFPAQIMKDGARQLATRKLTQDNLHTLCDDIPNSSVWACYLSLPQWWMRTFFDYKKVGKLCNDIVDEQQRKQCFVGVGVQVNYKDARFDPEKVKEYCQQMPTLQASDLCLMGAKWDIRAKNVSYYKRICEYISSDSKQYCNYYPQNFVNSIVP